MDYRPKRKRIIVSDIFVGIPQTWRRIIAERGRIKKEKAKIVKVLTLFSF